MQPFGSGMGSLLRIRDYSCWTLSVSLCFCSFGTNASDFQTICHLGTDTAVIEADYSALLTNLLRYPAPSPTYPFDPSLILAQAIFLRDNISPASGVEVVLQNQDLLGVKAQPPEREQERAEEPIRRAGPGRGSAPVRGRPSTSASPGQGMGQKAGVQGFAQGWIDRAQAAGLDKAVLSAVSDLRVCPQVLCKHTKSPR